MVTKFWACHRKSVLARLSAQIILERLERFLTEHLSCWLLWWCIYSSVLLHITFLWRRKSLWQLLTKLVLSTWDSIFWVVTDWGTNLTFLKVWLIANFDIFQSKHWFGWTSLHKTFRKRGTSKWNHFGRIGQSWKFRTQTSFIWHKAIIFSFIILSPTNIYLLYISFLEFNKK